MHNASTAADCAEMQRLGKIGCFLHFGETGDSPDTFIFYFQHNRLVRKLLKILFIFPKHCFLINKIGEFVFGFPNKSI